MGNPIYRSPSSSPTCAAHGTTAGASRRAAVAADLLEARAAAALADADHYFGRAGDVDGPGPRTRARREGVADVAGDRGSGWGVGLRWGLPPLPAIYQRLGRPPPAGGGGAARGDFYMLRRPPPDGGADFMDDAFLNPYLRREVAAPPAAAATSTGHGAAADSTTTAATRSLDRLHRELMLSALDPSDWDVAFGGGGEIGSGGARRRAGGDGGDGAAGAGGQQQLRQPGGGGGRHPSHLATQLLRASAGDAAVRVLEVQATLAALEGRLGALEAARRARAAAAAAAGRMV